MDIYTSEQTEPERREQNGIEQQIQHNTTSQQYQIKDKTMN